jgi:hypothetical protein
MHWVFIPFILFLACAPPLGPEPLPYRFSLDILDSPDPLANDDTSEIKPQRVNYFGKARKVVGRPFSGPTGKAELFRTLLGREIKASVLKGEGLSLVKRRVAVGDLVFFNNTRDSNGNGKQDDALSEVGLVVAVRGSRIRFAYLHAQRLRLGRLNLRRPTHRRRYRGGTSGPLENTYLRPVKKGESLSLPRLAGQLLAGFAPPP